MFKRGQGQSWSLDVILATVVFLLVLGVFYSLVTHEKTNTKEDMQFESRTLLNNLDKETGLNTGLAVLQRGALDPTKLSELYGQDYNGIKQQLGIESEFCIYIVDQKGNIISVKNDRNESMVGFGSPDYTINDIPCGSVIG